MLGGMRRFVGGWRHEKGRDMSVFGFVDVQVSVARMGRAASLEAILDPASYRLNRPETFDLKFVVFR